MMTYILEVLPSQGSAAPFYTSVNRSNDNAGFDLFVPEQHVLAPGERKLVSMGVKVRMRVHQNDGEGEAVHYWMPPRSSISKTGLVLLNSIGVIDRTYRGELMAFLWNTKSEPVTIARGDRLVQVVAPDMGHIAQVEVVQALDETVRGEGGFGSSGR